jgi:serine/threonine protein kinase
MIGKKILSYEIKSLIGEGGMGNVYLAEHVQLGRKVAVKSLHQQLVKNESLRARFKQEASTMAHLQHPGIVSLYDYVEEDDGLYLVMELVDGKPLDEYIRSVSGPIPAERAVPMMTKILDAFAYAHSKGIVHRDIKPSNILLMNNGEVKILDFGIAKMLSEAGNKLTKTGTQMGTVFYMSPEQVQGKDVDIRSDIYALGVTFFQMLTGVCPYDGMTTEYEVYGKIVNEPLPAASAFYPGIPPALDHVIGKATMKRVQDRFQNCTEFSHGLNMPQNIQMHVPAPNMQQPVNTNQTAFNAPPFQAPSPNFPQQQQPVKSEKVNVVAVIAFLAGLIAVIFPWLLRPHEFYVGLTISSLLTIGAVVMGIIGLVRKSKYAGASWLFALGALLMVIPMLITDVIRASDYARYLSEDYELALEDNEQQSQMEWLADSMVVADSVAAAEMAYYEEEAELRNQSGIEISNSWMEHNIYVSGEKGMKVHLSFIASNLINKSCYVRLHFYTEDGYSIYNSGFYSDDDGKLSAIDYFTPPYESSTYENFEVFIPYSAFDNSSMSGTYKVQAQLCDANNVYAISDFLSFTYGY